MASAGAHHHRPALQARYCSSRDHRGTDRVARAVENARHDPGSLNTADSLVASLKKVEVPVPEYRRLGLELRTMTMALSSFLSSLDVEDKKMVASPRIDHIPSHAAGDQEAEEDPWARMWRVAELVMPQGSQ